MRIKAERTHKSIWWAYLILGIALSGGAYVFFLRNPLPNDEVLITHFNLHHAEFEQLIRNFRAYDEPNPAGEPKRNIDINALMKNIEVQRISNKGSIWLPSPYQIKTGKQVKALIEAHEGQRLFRQFGAVKLHMQDKRFEYLKIGYGFLEKGYYHIPEIPEIQEGQMRSPVDGQGRSNLEGRVLQLLDVSPSELARGECAFRPLAPHWYIYFCRSF